MIVNRSGWYSLMWVTPERVALCRTGGCGHTAPLGFVSAIGKSL